MFESQETTIPLTVILPTKYKIWTVLFLTHESKNWISVFIHILCWWFSGSHLHKYSKVLDSTQLGAIETVPLPECPTQAWSKPEPLNITAPENLHKQRWLLSINLDQVGACLSLSCILASACKHLQWKHCVESNFTGRVYGEVKV